MRRAARSQEQGGPRGGDLCVDSGDWSRSCGWKASRAGPLAAWLRLHLAVSDPGRLSPPPLAAMVAVHALGDGGPVAGLTEALQWRRRTDDDLRG